MCSTISVYDILSGANNKQLWKTRKDILKSKKASSLVSLWIMIIFELILK